MNRIDRRAFLKATAGAAGLLVLPACRTGPGTDRDTRRGSPTPVERPTVRIPGGPFGPPSPFGYNGGPGYWRMSFIYDTLLWTDASGELLPWLASDHEASADGTTYTFRLRDDVRWQDGRPLTAEDVAFTFQYFRRQPFLPPLVVAQPFGVADATATGEGTVEVRLEAPIVTFLRQVAAAVPIVPKHVWERVRNPVEARDPELLVGSGPYRLESFSPEEGSYLYTANDELFLGRPFVERIEMVPVGPEELTALRAGELDGASTPVEGVTPDALAPFEQDEEFGVISLENGFAFPLYWNLQRGGPLADVRVRKAMAHAIDREDLVRRIVGGNGTPGNPGFLPPDHPYHVEVEQYPFDLEAAGRLLDEAGYREGQGGIRQGRDGRPLSFTLSVPASIPPALSDVLVSGLRRAGIEVRPNVIDIPRMFESKMRGEFDMIITLYPGPSGPGLSGDPDYLRSIYAPPGPSFHSVPGYRNRDVQRLAQAQLVTADENERRAIVGQLQRLVAADLPVLPLYYSTLYFAYRRATFDQWYFTPGGGFGPGLPAPYNKHALVTGHTTGLEVRETAP